MTTIRQLITEAMRLNRVVAANEVPTDSDMQVGKEALVSMIDSMQADLLNIYTTSPRRFLLEAGVQDYTLGPALDSAGNPTGADWIIERPVRVERAVILQNPTVVVPELPNPDFSALPLWGVAPLTVNFTDESTLTDGWQWDFENLGVVDSTDQNPTYVYTTPGLYSPKLTGTNEFGSNSIIKTDYITIVGASIANGTFNPAGSSPIQIAYSPAVGFLVGKVSGGSQRAAISADGLTWANDTCTQLYLSCLDLAASPTGIVMSGSGDNSVRLYSNSSTNQLSAIFFTSQTGPVTWSDRDNQFVAMMQSSANLNTAVSPTGVDGTWVVTPNSATAATFKYALTATSTGYYLSCADTSSIFTSSPELWFSADLVNWEQVVVPGTRIGFWSKGVESGSVTVIGSAVYGTESIGELVVIEGSTVTVVQLPGPDDGTTLFLRRTFVAKNDDGVFMAVVSIPSAVNTTGLTARNMVYVSNNGYDWSEIAILPDSPAGGLAFGNGVFVTTPLTTSGTNGNNKSYVMTLS